MQKYASGRQDRERRSIGISMENDEFSLARFRRFCATNSPEESSARSRHRVPRRGVERHCGHSGPVPLIVREDIAKTEGSTGCQNSRGEAEHLCHIDYTFVKNATQNSRRFQARWDDIRGFARGEIPILEFNSVLLRRNFSNEMLFKLGRRDTK